MDLRYQLEIHSFAVVAVVPLTSSLDVVAVAAVAAFLAVAVEV